MKIKVKLLSEKAVMPSFAYKYDAGADLVAISKFYYEDNIIYGTGLAIEIPKGYVGLIYPRSSVYKKDLLLANSVGVIDSGYRGEILVVFKKVGENEYNIGEKIAQLIIVKLPNVKFIQVDELSNSERQNKGFGSSDKK